MNGPFRRLLILGVLFACSAADLRGADQPAYERKEDVIYGRKYGTALTLDVFTPRQNANGAAIVFAVSGGWFSAHAFIDPTMYSEFLKRGYTVFAVVHGSQPKFTIPEVLEDMHRAVRYIRHHAARYKIDSNRIGISGASAGGHLSLMQGTAGKNGDPKAGDPVDRESSRVQAVACFFPPTDFLNYGKEGQEAIGNGILKDFKAPFDFREFDGKLGGGSFVLITDPEKRRAIAREISPINHVTAHAAPTLIMHGDADLLVPIQQAQIMIDKLKKAGVDAELVVKHKGGHGWDKWHADITILADWFDKHLKR